LSFAFVALGKGLIEPTPQVSIGKPKSDHLVIERRGHVASQPITPYSQPDYYWPAPAPADKGVRLDHVLVEWVKSA
jgi:hypothetical protein